MSKTEEQAKRLHTHKVVFTGSVDIECAVRAMLGQTTRAIAEALGISESMAQYRIQKAQDSVQTRFRSDYRNCTSLVAKNAFAASRKFAWKEVESSIAPRFTHLRKV